jgi:hypothetical protein
MTDPLQDEIVQPSALGVGQLLVQFVVYNIRLDGGADLLACERPCVAYGFARPQPSPVE